jgi:uncharacterized RDD family membrane protein YckC
LSFLGENRTLLNQTIQMANYFYAANGQSNGPLTIEQIDDLVKTGNITPDTLVWKEGMPDWQPYSTVRAGAQGGGGVALAAAPPVAGSLVCSVCGQLYPPDQVIRYGATPVCGNCKPQFLQRLREGATVGGALDYAGFGKRFGAKFLDTIIVYAINFAVGFGAAMIGGEDPSVTLVALAVNMLIGFGYPIFFLGKWGQTLGKMALGIKVVTPTGEPITYGRAAGRVASEIITGFTFGIGYLMMLWDDEKRTLHDRIAGTRVVNVNK